MLALCNPTAKRSRKESLASLRIQNELLDVYVLEQTTLYFWLIGFLMKVKYLTDDIRLWFEMFLKNVDYDYLSSILQKNWAQQTSSRA